MRVFVGDFRNDGSTGTAVCPIGTISTMSAVASWSAIGATRIPSRIGSGRTAGAVAASAAVASFSAMTSAGDDVDESGVSKGDCTRQTFSVAVGGRVIPANEDFFGIGRVGPQNGMNDASVLSYFCGASIATGASVGT